MSSTPSSSAGTYVYCIVRGEPFRNAAAPWRVKAIGNPSGPVYTVHFMDLAAVVSDSPVSRYDVSRQNMVAHQLVIEEAMTRSDILPVRFGTVGKSVQQVEERLLKRKFGEFHYMLQYIQGRVELGLKVFWNRERLFAEIAAEDERIRALRDSLVGKPPEQTHYSRIELGQHIEEAIIYKRDQEAEVIIESLRPLAVETKVNRILTDTMVLNASFLVEETNGRAFDAQINALDASHSGRLVLKYVGPLPPYNFINITVQWEED